MVKYTRRKRITSRRRYTGSRRRYTGKKKRYTGSKKRYTGSRRRYSRKKVFNRGMSKYCYELFPGVSSIWKRLAPVTDENQMNNWTYKKIDVGAMVRKLALIHGFTLDAIQWIKLKIWNKGSKTVPKGFLMALAPNGLLPTPTGLADPPLDRDWETVPAS